MEYIIRTTKADKKTHIMVPEKPVIGIGKIYTDFLLNPGSRDIDFEEIVDYSNSLIGNIRIYSNGELVSVNQGRKKLGSLSLQGEYRENGVIVPYRRISKTILLGNQNYKPLEERGLSHAYFFDEQSSLTSVFCFEKEGEISGVVDARQSSEENALKGLLFVLAKRLEAQDFIFEFIRK